MNLNVNLLGGSHLLRALGLEPDGMLGDLQQMQQQQLGMLRNLSDSFGSAAGRMGAGMLANLLQGGGIPGQGCCVPPNASQCGCGGQYAQPQNFDFGATPGQNPFSFGALMQRGQGAQFERLLNTDPFMKASVEMFLGGKIMNDGMADGRIQVQPFPGGQNPRGSAAAQGAMGFLDQISRAAQGTGLPMAGPQMFNGMILGALQNLMGQIAGGGGNAAGANNNFNFNSNAVGAAANNGRHAPTRAGPHVEEFGIGKEGDFSSVLNDSSLTVEDKVTLMLMLIMKKMDKDIEKQAAYINEIQQQQGEDKAGGGGKGGGKGGGGGAGGGEGSSPSIDVETMKLKRMIDKRGQMFDMLRQIIDKYNETAKNVIQSIGR
jgi:hypothetical protein